MRDQMATFLRVRGSPAGHHCPSKPPQPFSDVAASAHRDAIAQMAELGLVQGTGDGIYEPAEPVKRGQMAAVRDRPGRAARHREAKDGSEADNAFTDDDGTAHEAEINRAVALGPAPGTAETSFRSSAGSIASAPDRAYTTDAHLRRAGARVTQRQQHLCVRLPWRDRWVIMV
jgi:hypothetical protein